MTGRAFAALTTLALLTACTESKPAEERATLEVAVPDKARGPEVERVLDGRLRSFGVVPTRSDVEGTVVTVGLPRRLTDAEVDALRTIGRLTFRPVERSLDPNTPAEASAHDCTSPDDRTALGLTHAGKDASTVVACEVDGTVKYVLGPAELTGSDVRTARAELPRGQEQWVVQLTMKDAARWAELTEKLEQQQLAIVVDGVVQSAPTINGRIDGGTAEIAGDFTEQSTRELAAVLSGGPLPEAVVITQRG